MLDTLEDAEISTPVFLVAYFPGEAVIIMKRQGGKRSVPCSGEVLLYLGMREGRLVALMSFERNFGE